MTVGMMHHGIDLGDGTVIHFSGADKSTARVIRTSIKAFEWYRVSQPFPYERLIEFASYEFGSDVEKALRNRPQPSPLPPKEIKLRSSKEIINEAFKCLGTTFRENKYNAARNNCEHFATYCATGHPFSLQVLKDYEYSERKSSLGGLMAIFVTEFQRYKLNPYAKPKDGWNYVGTSYRDEKSGYLYHEEYSEPYTSASWSFCRSNHGSFERINQTEVPYPLTQLVHYYKDKNDQVREETISN